MDLGFPDLETEFAAGTGKLGIGDGVVTAYDGEAFAIFTHSSNVFIKVSHVADKRLVHSSNFCTKQTKQCHE